MKNGISWTRDGVKTVVQVSEQNRSVVLIVQPLDESLELECLQVSSSVIQKILRIKKEFCPACTYQSVRDYMNKFIIFAGRNPFVSNWFYLVVYTVYYILFQFYTEYC